MKGCSLYDKEAVSTVIPEFWFENGGILCIKQDNSLRRFCTSRGSLRTIETTMIFRGKVEVTLEDAKITVIDNVVTVDRRLGLS